MANRKAKRHVRFIWGSGDALPGEWKLGLWGSYDRGQGTHAAGLAVSVRGLLRWLGVLAVVAYLAAATALFAWLSRRPYNLVTYGDTLLLPVRWAHIRESMGRSLIEEGLQAVKEQRWSDGLSALRAGLARAPHDNRARLELARFYLAINRRPQALKLVTDDLDNGYPGRRYLESVFEMAAAGEDNDLIVSVCDRYLPTEKDDHDWLLTRKVQALLGGHRAEEALALTEQQNASALMQESHALALLDLGRGDEAVRYLQEWETHAGAAAAQVKRLEVRAYRETKRFPEMDATLEQLRQLSPTDPRTYIYGIIQAVLAGRHDTAERWMSDFLFRFASLPQQLLALAGALGEAPDLPLIQRCRDEAAAHGFPLRQFDLALVQVQIKSADWSGANQTLTRLKPVPGRSFALDTFVYTLLQRLVAAAASPDDAAQSTLVAFITERPLPMKVYRETAETLIDNGRSATAQSILAAASIPYPTSRSLAALRERADRAERDRLAALAAAKAASAPKDAAPGSGLEKTFFDQIGTLAQDGKWTEAAQTVRELRLAKPAWLARRAAEVLDWQMQIAAHTGDALELLSAVRLYLDGTRERAERVLEIAREVHDAGAAADADRLVGEVLRKPRDYPPAARLLREWHPPAPAKTAEKTSAPKT